MDQGVMGDARTGAAMLIIGDEILSGRTREANMPVLATELGKRGIALHEVRIVSDQHDEIVDAVRALSQRYGSVFTSGGIGPTHDDVTADAIAAAFETPIDVREDARAVLQAHYDAVGVEMNAARLRMARIPEGATLIDNPISAAPGFSLGNVHVMAGVPSVFTAMVASVLPGLTGGDPILSASLAILRGEGDVAADLTALDHEFAALSFGSYPFQRDGAYGTTVVIRGTEAAQIDAARTRLADLYAADLI